MKTAVCSSILTRGRMVPPFSLLSCALFFYRKAPAFFARKHCWAQIRKFGRDLGYSHAPEGAFKRPTGRWLQFPSRAIPAEHLLELRDLNGKNRQKIFSFLRRHRALVRDNISIFVANTAQRFHAKKFENSVQRFLLAISKIFELHDSDLFSRKKLEDAFELFGIKTAIDIGKAPRFDRQRLRDPPRLFFERIQKIERLAALESLHVTVSECAIDRISQQDDEFDSRIVISDPLHRPFPIQITRCAVADDCRSCDRREMSVQEFVVDRARENFLVVKEMEFLPVRQRDLGMLLQEITQRSRAGLLRAGDNEIEPLDFMTFQAEHRVNRALAVA